MVGDIPSLAAVAFPSARDAERRVAGLPAAARIVGELAEAGFAGVWLAVPEGESIGAAAMDEVHRLGGPIAVWTGAPEADQAVTVVPSDRLLTAATLRALRNGQAFDSAASIDLRSPRAAAEILARTGKAGDGPVSRWLNRPVSRRLSALLLRIPGLRPIHATAGTVVLALLMFAALVAGGPVGLIAGGLLFHAASVFDGIDGEVARATHRTSQAGATLDSLVDAATNGLMIVGVTANLALAGHERATLLGGWGLALFVIGQGLIAGRAARSNAPVGFDGLKHHYRARMTGPIGARLIRFLTVVTSRDFFALLFAALILAGWAIAVLYIFAAAATVWIVFVAASLLAPPGPGLATDPS